MYLYIAHFHFITLLSCTSVPGTHVSGDQWLFSNHTANATGSSQSIGPPNFHCISKGANHRHRWDCRPCHTSAPLCSSITSRQRCAQTGTLLSVRHDFPTKTISFGASVHRFLSSQNDVRDQTHTNQQPAATRSERCHVFFFSITLIYISQSPFIK